jgi:hypothetical protein
VGAGERVHRSNDGERREEGYYRVKRAVNLEGRLRARLFRSADWGAFLPSEKIEVRVYEQRRESAVPYTGGETCSYSRTEVRTHRSPARTSPRFTTGVRSAFIVGIAEKGTPFRGFQAVMIEG